MKQTTILVLAILLVGSLSGCIENIRDLKDKVTGAQAEAAKAEDLAKQGLDLAGSSTNAKNQTVNKPPVARMAIYGANGALVYKATFVGEDVSGPVLIDADANLTLVATDSEALGAAKVATYSWVLAGKAASGSKTAATFVEPGIYPIVLLVTDSNGLTDTQTVILGVPPKPFDVSKNVTVGQVLGAGGAGQEGDGAFEVSAADAKMPATIVQVKVTVASIATCDVVLSIVDKDNKVVGKSDVGGVGSGEAATMPALPEGKYKIVAMPGDACVTTPDGFPAQITTTFLPIIPGFGAGEGHAHQH